MPSVYPLECQDCGLVFLSSFSHIEPDFYEKSKMHDNQPINRRLVDSQALLDAERRYGATRELVSGKSVLDFGCGQGLWLERIVSLAKNASGLEPEAALYPVLIEKGLKVYRSIDEISTDAAFDIITMFHVLEHLPDPLSVLKVLKKRLKPGGFVIIEVPNANDALLTIYKNQAFSNFTYWGCHLFLYTNSTLKTLMEQAGFTLKSLEQMQRYPLSNHMFWLASGRPGGGEVWPFLNTPDLMAAYQAALTRQEACDTIWACFS